MSVSPLSDGRRPGEVLEACEDPKMDLIFNSPAYQDGIVDGLHEAIATAITRGGDPLEDPQWGGPSPSRHSSGVSYTY
ncbi:MAG TPA: hypothetical protein VMT30_04675 [Candidatus Saccharimonadia bacterium]|nr:hypothetical protein [Candidatus Saccharimonadia bacterium]